MTATLDTLIDQLATARRERRTLDATPFADTVRTQDDAYLVQAGVANELGWFPDGQRRFWKSGGASRTATLNHSALPPAGVWTSPARLGDWPFALGGIEAEVALRLAVDVDAQRAKDLDVDSASALVDAMAVSIELVDGRWDQGTQAPPLLKLADLAVHGALVLGDWVPYVRRDWSAQHCRVTMGDRGTTEFTGSLSIGDPEWVLPALLRHMTVDGQVAPAGTVVTTGTWCGLLIARPGDRVVVAFDGIGEAEVQA